MKPMMKTFIILLSIGFSTSLAQSNEVKIRVDGLSCPFCAYGLEKKLNDLDGVEIINIDFEEGLVLMKVTDPGKISEEAIRAKIVEAGFTPKEIVFTAENKKPNNDDQILLSAADKFVNSNFL